MHEAVTSFPIGLTSLPRHLSDDWMELINYSSHIPCRDGLSELCQASARFTIYFEQKAPKHNSTLTGRGQRLVDHHQEPKKGVVAWAQWRFGPQMKPLGNLVTPIGSLSISHRRNHHSCKAQPHRRIQAPQLEMPQNSTQVAGISRIAEEQSFCAPLTSDGHLRNHSEWSNFQRSR